jgi:PAS domain S-box-containing protein
MTEAAPENVEVLLVDDRPANLQALEAILTRPDYTLVFASSGAEALREVLEHDFAAMLIDVNMPYMDGFELASAIKGHTKYSAIPILFVTATPADRRHIFEAYRVGAVDYLEKPLDEHVVRSKVDVFVQLHRQRRELQRQAERLRVLEIDRVRLETERRYRNLAEAIPQIVWIASPAAEAEFVNAHWETATGMARDASLGHAWRAAMHPEDGQRFEDAWAKGSSGTEPIVTECRLLHPSHDPRWYLFRASPEIENGHTSRWLGTFTDVDDQKRAEQQARAAIAVRDEFLSVASHELRTPITPLQLHLQSLLKMAREEHWQASSEQRLSTAIRMTTRLNTLVDRLLDVSRISNGKLTISREELDLDDTLRELVDRFREEITRARCTVTLEAEACLRGSWDRLRIEQVVTNLLTNALKYAPGTPIEITAQRETDRAVVVVRDHGKGIDDAQLSRIFDRFERGVSTNHNGGLGLGLYIARQIVTAHGGTIRVESHPAGGAEFTVDLPLNEVTPSAITPSAA